MPQVRARLAVDDDAARSGAIQVPSREPSETMRVGSVSARRRTAVSAASWSSSSTLGVAETNTGLSMCVGWLHVGVFERLLDAQRVLGHLAHHFQSRSTMAGVHRAGC